MTGRERAVEISTKLSGLFDALKAHDWIANLLVRASVGYMFMSSGWGKLHRLPAYVEDFRGWGIPAPELQAPFAATVEFIGGAALIVGLGVRLFAPMLAVTMIVALFTVILKDPKNHVLGNLFYAPEWLLLVILVWLAMSGAGRASMDRIVRKKLFGKT